MKWLNLSYNLLSGTIPTELGTYIEPTSQHNCTTGQQLSQGCFRWNFVQDFASKMTTSKWTAQSFRGSSMLEDEDYEPAIILNESTNSYAFPLEFDWSFDFRDCAPAAEEVHAEFAAVEFSSAILNKPNPQGKDNPFRFLADAVSFTGEVMLEP